MQNNHFLGIADNELEKRGAIHTAREIHGQPDLWIKTWQAVKRQSSALQQFLYPLLSRNDLEIILTGAGSSAFIGEALQGPMHKYTGRCTKAIATTDLVSHPELSIPTNVPVLLVSFARSGNSPESIAAARWTDLLGSDVYHLIITCNPQGILAREIRPEKSIVFLLPAEADDQSLAMTGSFSSMLLSGLLIAQLRELDQRKSQVELLAAYGRLILGHYLEQLKSVAQQDFKRAVFLGSGPARGVARESHLKLQELTDGRIICKHDSYLGFRHGPRAVVNKDTLLVFLFSNDEYVQQYEVDLVRAINNGEKGMYRLGVMEEDIPAVNLDMKIILAQKNDRLDEEFLSIGCVLPAQVLGFFKSLQLGLRPDNPSASGAITRVVQGVQIYPYEKAML